jgi:hypothetical protein
VVRGYPTNLDCVLACPYILKVIGSENGNDFNQISDGTNRKGSSSAESYEIDDAKGSYLMMKVTGSSSDKRWVSIKQIGVFGKPV